MVKIKSPNNRFTGIRAGVSFVKGEANTENPWSINWFKNNGYTVGEIESVSPHCTGASIDSMQPESLAKYTVRELRELCKARGLKGYSNKSEEELLAMLMEGEG